MGVKLRYEDVKSFIDKEDKLLSKEYNNNKELLEIKCGKCNLIYIQMYDRYKRGCRHRECKNKGNVNNFDNYNKNRKILLKEKKDIIRECVWCKNDYNVKRRKQQFCSKDCAGKHLSKDPEVNKERGRVGGNKSMLTLCRRSKGEIDFADLCIDYFGNENIICNELFFKDKNNNLWDADIIITHLRIAVLYNGIFHYKKVYKDQKLERMIAKDRLKEKIIIQNGYTYYIVKDLKSYNKKFVIDQFNLFIHKLSYNIVLREMNVNNHKKNYNYKNVLDGISKINLN
jgi:hypothetical protein